MIKKEEVKVSTNNKFGKPFYDNENGTGLCTICKKVWKKEQQLMHTTRNKRRTYATCPQCKRKQPLRKTPRTRDAWLRKYPPKRI